MGIANILTIIRLILIPFFIYFFLLGYNYVALLLFTLAALTDWLDGYLARAFSQVTSFGKFIDPLSDRLLIISTLVVLVVKDFLPLLAVIIVISRDLFTMIGYQYMQWRDKEVPVTYLGKTATAILMSSIILIIASVNFGVLLFYLGVFLSVASFMDYVRRATFVLKYEER